MVHWLLENGADPRIDYEYGKPIERDDSHVIEGIFWHPGTPEDPTWQRKSQQWLITNGFERPTMPEHYRLMRERLGFAHEEDRIPLL